MSVYQRAALVASFCLVLGFSAACGKKAPAVAPPPPPPPAAPTTPPAPPPPPSPPAAAPTPRALSEDEMFAQKSLAQINNERPLGDVYFNLDESSLKDEGKAALSTNATWLKRWATTKINIEGHCDERGTAIQPRPRRTPRQRGEVVSGGARRARRSHRDRQQGQRGALLHRVKRELLAAEPPRSLRGHREVNRYRKLAAIFSAASLGLGAAVMGRPITM